MSLTFVQGVRKHKAVEHRARCAAVCDVVRVRDTGSATAGVLRGASVRTGAKPCATAVQTGDASKGKSKAWARESVGFSAADARGPYKLGQQRGLLGRRRPT